MSSSLRSNFRSVEIVTGPGLFSTIGWVVLAVFVQSVLARDLAFHGAVPSFVTIAVVLYALRAGVRRGSIVAIVAGVLEDSFSGSGGAWTIATTLMALGISLVSRRFFSDGFAMLSMLVALAILVRDGLFWGVMSLEGYPPGLGLAHAHATLWQAAMTGVATIIYLVARARLVADRTAVERFAR